jgi:hypothetical protein
VDSVGRYQASRWLRAMLEAQFAQLEAGLRGKPDMAAVLARAAPIVAAVERAEHLGIPLETSVEAMVGRADAAWFWEMAGGAIAALHREEAERAAAELHDRPLRWLKAVAQAQLAQLPARAFGSLERAVVCATLDSILAAAERTVDRGIPVEAACATAFMRPAMQGIRDRAIAYMHRTQAERAAAEARSRSAIPLPECCPDPNEPAVDPASVPDEPHRAEADPAAEAVAPVSALANTYAGQAERAAAEDGQERPDPNEGVVEPAGADVCSPSAVPPPPSVPDRRKAADDGDASDPDVSTIRDAEAVLGTRLTESQRRMAAGMVKQFRDRAERARTHALAARRWPSLSRPLRRTRASRAPRRAAHRSAVAPARDGPPPDDAPTALATRYAPYGAADRSGAPDVTREPSIVRRWVPPYDLGAEPAALSAMLRSGDVALRIVAAPLRPEHLYSEAHGRIYAALAELVAAGHPVDVGRSVLHDGERRALVGGPSFLVQLAGATPAVGKIILADGRIRRASTTHRNDAVGKALSYVREQTMAGEPVRGIEVLAKALHVHRQRASAAVAHLAREKLIVNEAEQIGRGRPKPRLWACSAADFTQPPRAKANAEPTCMQGAAMGTGVEPVPETCGASVGAQRVPGADGDATNTRDVGLTVRPLTMAQAASAPAGTDVVSCFLDFEDVGVVYRGGRGNDVVGKALRHVRERTMAGEPVRGIEDLATAIHVQRQRASAAVAQLARENLIVNEAERVGRGRPKPRLWACSAADFTRPPRAEAKKGGPEDEALDQVLRYLRARTFEQRPVCGTDELAKGIRVHHRRVREAVAQLLRDKLIADEPEQVGRGKSKPRLWALTTADFTAPARPGGAQ